MQGARILVVEDESIVAMDISQCLTACGYRVVGTASSGADAVRKASESRPDLVLMDIHLQGEMDGIQAAGAISSSLGVPIIYLSALTSPEMLSRAGTIGAFGYLVKPFEGRELQAAIEVALSKHAMDQKLGESVQWLAAGLKAMGDAMIATNLEGQIKYINSVAERLTGWRQAQALGQAVSVVFKATNHAGESLWGNQQAASCELPNHTILTSLDGTSVPVEHSLSPIQDERGNPLGSVLLFRDVSERQHSEQALRQYARRLETLHAIDTAILAAESPHEIAQATLQRIHLLVPCMRSSLVLFDLNARQANVLAVWTQGSTRVDKGRSIPLENYGLQDCLYQGFPHTIDNVQSYPQRSPVQDQLLAEGVRSIVNIPLLVQGQLIGALNLGGGAPAAFSPEDIEVACQVAAQLAIAIRQARLTEQLQRDATELASLNQAGQAVLSSLKLDQVLDLVIEQVQELIHAEGVSILLADPESGDPPDLIFAAAAGPGASSLGGLRVPSTAGLAGWSYRSRQPALVDDAQHDTRFYGGIDANTALKTRSIMAVPLLIKGEPAGVLEAINKTEGLFNHHDLALLETIASWAALAIENARLYRLEQDQIRRLEQSQARLIQAEKMSAFGRVFASIAHEINNPLQAVQGCLSLAEEELAGKVRPDKLSLYLSTAGREVERIIVLERQMRDLYRPAQGERQPIDLDPLVDGVLQLTSRQLQYNNIQVQRQALPLGSLPCIYANANHIKQVLLNLVLNAIDAMTGRGGMLTIEMGLDSLQHIKKGTIQAVRIEIGDSGEGMAPEVLERLFEPFVTTKKTGTGLGLAICYEIIRAHEGQISAVSQPGKGTRFTLLLPAASA